jgi:hypothetical protein
MFESPILIYSHYCDYSKRFIGLLKEYPEVGEYFVKINIDVDPQTRQRPQAFYQIQKELDFKITEVPTIIVEDGQYVLSGEEAFKWIEYKIEAIAPKDLGGFNPNEMGAFSDGYSPYGEKDMNNASEQTFCFVNKIYEGIETPPEDAIPKMSQEDLTQKQKMRDTIKIAPQARMGYSDTYIRSRPDAPKGKAKGKEIDNRLEQLMMEREQLNRKPPPPKQVDFTNGKVMYN